MFLHRFIVLTLGMACWQLTGATGLAQYSNQRGTSRQRRQAVVARRPVDRSDALRRNEMPVRNTISAVNEVITPISLTATRLEAAKEGVDRQIRDLIEDLRPRMRHLFPDKLDALSDTSGWTPQQRTALTKALRAGDPEEIYKAWLEAEPNNTGGADRIARAATVERAFTRLEQSAGEGAATSLQIEEVRDALDKLATSDDKAGEVTGAFDAVDTWVRIRELLDEAEPDVGAAKVLPKGRVKIIKNPNFAVGAAVVLNNSIVMVGNRGQGGVEITRGNAAEALGLPVINDEPLADSEGTPQRSGTLIANPRRYGETVRYVLNGNPFIMRPGNSQKLKTGRRWRIEFDRGANAGVAEYALGDGTFVWTPTDRGWQLYKERFDVVIDNLRNPRDFHFVLNDEPLMVRAGHARKISNPYPMAIGYDRGNGSERVAKLLNFSGNVEVGINAQDNLLDLFPEQGNAKRAEEPWLFQ